MSSGYAFCCKSSKRKQSSLYWLVHKMWYG